MGLKDILSFTFVMNLKEWCNFLLNLGIFSERFSFYFLFGFLLYDALIFFHFLGIKVEADSLIANLAIWPKDIVNLFIVL